MARNAARGSSGPAGPPGGGGGSRRGSVQVFVVLGTVAQGGVTAPTQRCCGGAGCRGSTVPTAVPGLLGPLGGSPLPAASCAAGEVGFSLS